MDILFNIEDLIETISTRMSPISTKPRFCTKIRSRHSQCTKCLDICQTAAIFFEKDGIKMNENCVECGICAVSCPTGAIFLQEPTEAALYNKILKKGKFDDDIIVACVNTKGPRDVLNIPCLGSLSLELLLVLNQLPYRIYLLYDKETCDKCDKISGFKHYELQWRKILKLQEVLELEGNALKEISNIPKTYKTSHPRDELDIERRKLLTSTLQSLKNFPKTAFGNFAGKPKPKKVENSPTIARLAFLKRALSKAKPCGELDFVFFPHLDNICYFCGACSKLCPTGAIKQKEKESLILYQDRCVGCGLCQDICYYKSLELVTAKVIDITKNHPTTLAKGSKQSCSKCGRNIVASDIIKECPLCRNKNK